jgi:hypothetical protein
MHGPGFEPHTLHLLTLRGEFLVTRLLDKNKIKNVNFRMLSTIDDLCQELLEISKSNYYPLIEKVQ